MKNPEANRRVVNVGAGQVEILGLPHGFFSDMYYFFLNGRWTSFYLFVLIAYGAFNLCFAVLYALGGGNVENAHSFTDLIFFSVQTMATIGYGIMSPKTLYAHLLVGFESIFGILGMATITGLTFAKFSRPRARVIFSERAVVAQHDGVPTFMFRMGNARANQIAEATLTVVLVRRGRTQEGRPFTRMIDLILVRNKSPMFTLTWTAMHPIDAASPIFRDNAAAWETGGVQFVCSLTGYDPSTGQTIHARHTYESANVIWNSRLIDVLQFRGSSRPVLIDYTRFHDVEPDTAVVAAPVT